MRYMLDTNICIYANKNRPVSVQAALRANESADVPGLRLENRAS